VATAPPFSALGEFLGGVIASATEAAAHPQPAPKDPEPPPAASFVAEAADGPREDTAVTNEQTPARAPAEVVSEPRPPSCDKDRTWTRWTTRRLRTRIEEVFGIDVCKETVRRVLHRIGLSWKKAKKLLAKADPEKRIAFVADIRALLGRVLHEENLVLASRGGGSNSRGGGSAATAVRAPCQEVWATGATVRAPCREV